MAIKVATFTSLFIVCLSASQPVSATSYYEERRDLAKSKAFVARERSKYFYPKDAKKTDYFPTEHLFRQKRYEDAIACSKAWLEKLKDAPAKSGPAKEYINNEIEMTNAALAAAYRHAGKLKEDAMIRMEIYHNIKVKNSYKADSELRSAGEELIEAKEYTLAEEEYSKALKFTNPQFSIWPRQGLWKAYIAQGKTDTVREQMKQIPEIEASLADIHLQRQFRYSLIDIYNLLGDKQMAAKINEQLADKHCPICGSDKTIEPLSYDWYPSHMPAGYHAPSTHLPIEYRPNWWCTKDKIEF